MAGGYRRGAGRPKGAKGKAPRSDKGSKRGPYKDRKPQGPPLNQSDRDKLKDLLGIDLEMNAKAKAYSELLTRASKGDLTANEKRVMAALRAELWARYNVGEDAGAPCDDPDSKLFLEALLIAEDVDRKTKIQIANILLPYQHPKKGEIMGKKEEKMERASKAGQGRFAAGRAPLKLVK